MYGAYPFSRKRLAWRSASSRFGLAPSWRVKAPLEAVASGGLGVAGLAAAGVARVATVSVAVSGEVASMLPEVPAAGFGAAATVVAAGFDGELAAGAGGGLTAATVAEATGGGGAFAAAV